jgi:hypothetical protein
MFLCTADFGNAGFDKDELDDLKCDIQGECPELVGCKCDIQGECLGFASVTYRVSVQR